MEISKPIHIFKFNDRKAHNRKDGQTASSMYLCEDFEASQILQFSTKRINQHNIIPFNIQIAVEENNESNNLGTFLFGAIT